MLLAPQCGGKLEKRCVYNDSHGDYDQRRRFWYNTVVTSDYSIASGRGPMGIISDWMLLVLLYT